MQGTVKMFDPATREGIVVRDTDRVEVVLAANALERSIFRMLRQGQRVVFDAAAGDGAGEGAGHEPDDDPTQDSHVFVALATGRDTRPASRSGLRRAASARFARLRPPRHTSSRRSRKS